MRIQVGCDRVLYLSGDGDSRRLELGLPDFCNRNKMEKNVNWREEKKVKLC